MPSRIIREGIITSERINALSERAELFYRRLMSVADDYGRYFAHPSILRANCFPLKLTTITEKQITSWLNECIKARLVVIYNEGKHLIMLDFRQQTRAASKFPQPSENDLLIKCSTDVKQMLNLGEGEGEGGDVVEGVGDSAAFAASKRFIIPSLDDVRFIGEKSGLPEPECIKFHAYYESKGWTVGKSPMRDWKAALTGWRTRWQADQFKANGSHAKPAKQISVNDSL
jgi:hypothetical protein